MPTFTPDIGSLCLLLFLLTLDQELIKLKCINVLKQLAFHVIGFIYCLFRFLISPISAFIFIILIFPLDLGFTFSCFFSFLRWDLELLALNLSSCLIQASLINALNIPLTLL